jgi:hypothetical protein
MSMYTVGAEVLWMVMAARASPLAAADAMQDTNPKTRSRRDEVMADVPSERPTRCRALSA